MVESDVLLLLLLHLFLFEFVFSVLFSFLLLLVVVLPLLLLLMVLLLLLLLFWLLLMFLFFVVVVVVVVDGRAYFIESNCWVFVEHVIIRRFISGCSCFTTSCLNFTYGIGAWCRGHSSLCFHNPDLYLSK